jgi:glycosyltransferase involved in cell wall biosynthesis
VSGADPLHVGVNLVYLRPGGVGGSETYVRGLVAGLAALPGVRLTLFCSDEAADTFPGRDVVRVTRAAYSLARRLWAENWTLRRPLRASGADVLFSPGNFAAPLLPKSLPQVATVQDLQHLWLPANFTRIKRVQRSVMFRLTAARCRRLITLSEFTRHDVIERLRIPSDKVVAVFAGIDRSSARDEARLREAREQFGLARRFFYYPAIDAPHKNHATLVDALAVLRRRGIEDVELLCSGARSQVWEEVAARAQAAGVGDRVRHVGLIPHRTVFDLLRLAVALVFPSEFEGFGLPPLEAMQCDTPVLASSSASIPEIVGEGGWLLPARDAAAWADAMRTLLTESAERERWVARGRRNLERFSWDRCARDTLAVLRTAASASPRTDPPVTSRA